MMRNSEQYPFIPANSILGEASLRPYLPLTLIYQERSVPTSGLLDTGSMVNVLPYQVGVDLGAVWEQLQSHLTALGQTEPSHLCPEARGCEHRMRHH